MGNLNSGSLFNLIWKKKHFEVADVLSQDRLISFHSIDVQAYTQGIHWNLFEISFKYSAPSTIIKWTPCVRWYIQQNFDRVRFFQQMSSHLIVEILFSCCTPELQEKNRWTILWSIGWQFNQFYAIYFSLFHQSCGTYISII